jgi:hypothetical protein
MMTSYDLLIRYDEPETATAAVKWFDGTKFERSGGRLSVSIAKRPAEGNWGKGKGKGKGK